jgi:hypothetical protein
MEKEAVEAWVKERLGEVLDSWCVLGFSSKGDLISLFHAPTERDEAALQREYQDWVDSEIAPASGQEDEVDFE